MKKLLIFDLDGTLLDTLQDLHEAVNYALSHFDMPLRTLEQVRKDIGNGVEKLIERSVVDGKLNENYENTLQLFRLKYSKDYSIYTHPYPGMLETLLQLKQVGYRFAVATNKIQSVAIDLINKFYPNIFDYVQGDEPSVFKKPNSSMIDKILKTLKISKEHALYVGDTNVDEQTALNSNLDYILVTYGFRTLEEIKNSCQCTNLIAKPFDLLKKLETMRV